MRTHRQACLWLTRRLAVILTLAVVGAAPTIAGDAEDCENAERGEAKVAACTRAIESGEFQANQLADLYSWRSGAHDKHDLAAADLKESLRIKPGDTLRLGWMGHHYRAAGDLDAAIDSYTEAIKSDDKLINAYYARGVVYRLKGEYDKSISDFSAAIKLDPDDAQLYNGRGLAQQLKGVLDAAVVDFTSAASLDETFIEAHLNLGDAAAAQGDRIRAYLAYRDALKLAPTDTTTLRRLANLALADRTFEEAVKRFTALIDHQQDNPADYYGRGMAHALNGDLQAAIADMNKAAKLSPDDVAVYRARGLMHAAVGDDVKAIADYSHAIRLDNLDGELYTIRAWASHKAGRNRLALADSDMAVLLAPELRSAYLTRSEIRKALGDTAGAEADVSAAAKLSVGETEQSAADLVPPPPQRDQVKLAAAETAFLMRFMSNHKLLDPFFRIVRSVTGKPMADYSSSGGFRTPYVPNDEGRALVRKFQRDSGLKITGFVDQATFDKAIDLPAEVKHFNTRSPVGVSERVGDWWFERDKTSCMIWTTPTAIRGRFVPISGPKTVTVVRFPNLETEHIEGTFADGEVYADPNAVVVQAGARFELDDYLRPKENAKEIFATLGRRSAQFTVVGESKFGGKLEIDYSGDGFREAFVILDKRCGDGKLSVWLE